MLGYSYHAAYDSFTTYYWIGKYICYPKKND